MKRLVSTIAITLFWGLSLSSCTESAPEMSDDQILLLFSSTSLFSTSADAPKTIPKKAEECVRLLSGLEEAVFKDMPQEMLGQLKTECRQTISERLRDPALNPKNLKLEHVETAKFAQRLTTVRAKSQEEAKAFAARENERREAELAKQEQDQQRRRIQEAAEAIKNAQTQLASIKDDLPKRLTEAATACAEFDEAKRTSASATGDLQSSIARGVPTFVRKTMQSGPAVSFIKSSRRSRKWLRIKTHSFSPACRSSVRPIRTRSRRRSKRCKKRSGI